MVAMGFMNLMSAILSNEIHFNELLIVRQRQAL